MHHCCIPSSYCWAHRFALYIESATLWLKLRGGRHLQKMQEYFIEIVFKQIRRYLRILTLFMKSWSALTQRLFSFPSARRLKMPLCTFSSSPLVCIPMDVSLFVSNVDYQWNNSPFSKFKKKYLATAYNIQSAFSNDRENIKLASILGIDYSFKFPAFLIEDFNKTVEYLKVKRGCEQTAAVLIGC